ncbi:helix-turn-helix domain-containing protein [Rothia nasimurium]|uniref:helix-turn-helix domain-containing protein n=1 Tax=Rothia nasimurium TaxID=85336 RepID=UPI0023513AE5|nr:helix-turn-helix domain-containing protein [Rothia nasimurium]
MQTVLPLQTTREVAKCLGLSPSHVTRLVASGELTAVVKAPGKRGAFMFDPAEVEHFRAMRELQTVGKAKAHPLKEVG